MQYIIAGSIACIISVLITPLMMWCARKIKAIDDPNAAKQRKIHKKPMPLLGGGAIFISFSLVLAWYTWNTNLVLGGYMKEKYIYGILAGGLILMFGGLLDDKYGLSPKKQIIWPILAILAIITSGIGIEYITNPLGETWRLDSLYITLFSFNEVPYRILVVADAFTFIWMMGMMYATKLLDGLDGLVSGIGVIGSMILFTLSLSQEVGQPETALIAVIFGGACLGFWFWNFHPAKIYLGEGGSLLIGFTLGFISILSGAKIATALLIMGIPIFDVALVIFQRIRAGKSPFRFAGKDHLHYRFLAAGYSHRASVLIYYVLTLLFGLQSLLLRGKEKVIAFVMLVIFTLILVYFLMKKKEEKST